jgi:spermidine synthase
MTGDPPRSATAEAARPPSSRRSRRAYVELFLISFTILFFELACIRWFGSTVVFLTFFTNIVLIACFLGMSVGCLAASRKADLINAVIPLALVSVVLAYAVLWGYREFGRVTIDVGGQGSPQQVFFGTEERPKDPSRFVVPVEMVAGAFFALIALTFVGLGQALGRRLDALPDRVGAYTADIAGSLAGIAAFGVASYLRTPPTLWFAVSLGLALAFVTRDRPYQAVAVAAVLALLWLVPRVTEGTSQSVWSPYYKVNYYPRNRLITVNNIPHQGMISVPERGVGYTLPYLLNRDAGGRPFDDVLIVGAGSGNDVEAALGYGTRHVDAVEIEPVIQEIGRRDHPGRPYDDPRVSAHLDDGRSFIRRTDRKYDLAVFAVLDSLVLHSGYSSLRLESFLYTEQAFRDVKARLKPGGVFALYNNYRQGWVVGRLERMAEKVFGAPPVVISLPYQERIAPSAPQGTRLTLLLTGDPDSPRLRAIREALSGGRSFWANTRPASNGPINAYRSDPPGLPGDWQRIGLSEVEAREGDRLPSDDWPFLYLREATIPRLNLRGMAIVGAIALAILLAFAPVRTARPNGPMFFLGAGFMLLETKGVVHMALLFGSTWVVNSIVFFAILVLILLSNLYVLAVRPRRLAPYYAMLFAALLVNAWVPMAWFLALPGGSRVVASCAVVYLPIVFAGVIFAATFRDSRRPDVDFGSNIGGVILGGLCENLSLVVGFNHLLLVALAFYALSAILRPRSAWTSSPTGA